MTSQNVSRYVRYRSAGQTWFGILDGETSIRQLDGAPYLGSRTTGRVIRRTDDMQFLLPVDEEAISKVICVADNYNQPGEHKTAPHPFLSPKMQTSLITDGEAIEIPPESTHANHGGSLVLVIGKEGRSIPEAQALDHIFGVAVGNDITEPTWLIREGGFNAPDRILGKAIDTWGPLGTTIVSGIDHSNFSIETKINGQVVASGGSSDMVNSIAKLIYYISAYCTLLPGDLIYTGSPVALDGKAEIKPGDTVEVSIAGVGTLTNPVVARKRSMENPWWLQQLAEVQAGAR